MTAGRLYWQGDVCPSCDGTGRLPAPLEERFGGYIDGPEPAARDWLVHVSGASGLGVVDLKSAHLFSERFRIRERDTLRDMEDGLLVEHLARLRRVLVMAREDDLPDWFVTMTTQRHALANDELRWRHRAGDLGADRVRAETAWRERCDRVRERVDLGMLIAADCDKARPAGGDKWEACCPFHSDRSPSLSIDVRKGVWYCHGCRAGGDAFTYVELRYGLDFAGAVRHLEDRL